MPVNFGGDEVLARVLQEASSIRERQCEASQKQTQMSDELQAVVSRQAKMVADLAAVKLGVVCIETLLSVIMNRPLDNSGVVNTGDNLRFNRIEVRRDDIKHLEQMKL